MRGKDADLRTHDSSEDYELTSVVFYQALPEFTHSYGSKI